MTTLNGLPISWDFFIHGICARRRLTAFNKIQEECAQEEDRIVTREEKIRATEDQALIVQNRKNFNKKEKKEKFHHNKKKDKKQKNIKRYISNVRCYTCDEEGHLARYCLIHKRDTMLMLSNTIKKQPQY